MKTNAEIQRETQRMIERGRLYRDEVRPGLTDRETPPPRALVQLPDSTVTLHQTAPRYIGAMTLHRRRHIEAAIERGDLVYRLIVRETERDQSGIVLRERAPVIEVESDSGTDLLRAAYELSEEERLGEALESFAGCCVGDADQHVAEKTAVAQVEEILETASLAPPDRLRAKAEIIEFLDGRLEASAFIAHAIDRQCAREDCSQQQTVCCEQRMTIGQP